MRILLVFLVLVAACGGADERPRVRLATTTSTENSGLLAYLLPVFEEREGIEVQVIAVGTGQALKLGERGDADLVLVHARAREDAFVAAGHGVDRRDVMWNDFVILGPPSDPAKVRGTTDAAAALRQIAAAKAFFVSRGDDSGTHIREQAIWKGAGGVPSGKDFYLEAGQGMGRCLIMANERQAYVLADRGTYLALRKKLDLIVVVEGDPPLNNPYGAILVNPARHDGLNTDGARKLLDFLTSAEAKRLIGEFRVGGEVLFHPAALPK